MQTCYGIVATPLGHVRNGERVWRTPASKFQDVQESYIPVDLDHDRRPIGQIVHLQRDRHQRVWAVGHVADHITPQIAVRVGTELRHVESPLYFSAARVGDPQNGYLLVSVALTTSPARIGARSRGERVTFLPGELDCRSAPKRWPNLGEFERGLLMAAAEAVRFRGDGGAIVVRDAALDRFEGRTLERGAAWQLLDGQGQRRAGGPIRRSAPYKGIRAVR